MAQWLSLWAPLVPVTTAPPPPQRQRNPRGEERQLTNFTNTAPDEIFSVPWDYCAIVGFHPNMMVYNGDIMG